MAPIIDRSIRPLPGHRIHFTDSAGDVLIGDITDVAASPWSGAITYTVEMSTRSVRSVSADRVVGVVRYL